MISIARPKEFVREEALRKAMTVFWTKGYDGTNIPDLTAAMGLSRSSLYETFGDKQTLFAEALTYYSQLFAPERATAFENSTSVKQGLTEYFNWRIATVLNPEYPEGCFLTNTVAALTNADDPVRAAVTVKTDRIEADFYHLLQHGQSSGEIGPDTDIRALARFFVGVACGMNVIAKLHRDRQTLQDIVDVALAKLD